MWATKKHPNGGIAVFGTIARMRVKKGMERQNLEQSTSTGERRGAPIERRQSQAA